MFVAFLYGVLIWLGTAMFVGAGKANVLPGGAIAVALMLPDVPWYVAVPSALTGHLLMIVLSGKLKKKGTGERY